MIDDRACVQVPVACLSSLLMSDSLKTDAPKLIIGHVYMCPWLAHQASPLETDSPITDSPKTMAGDQYRSQWLAYQPSPFLPAP